MKNFKKIILISALFILFFIINANSYAKTISHQLSSTFFRLHILANSNSVEDQNLKLKVRDNIINYINKITLNENNKNAVIKIYKNHIEDLKKIAQQTIYDNGYNYNVNISIGNFYFPTKKYENISLPAGEYDALRIEIGDAVGENWWCSLFPPLCFIDISSGVLDSEGEKYLKENLSNEEFSIITSNSKKVKFKFKLVEFLNAKNI